MSLFQSFLLLIVGFVFLIKGADFFVDGSASKAAACAFPDRRNDGCRDGDEPPGMLCQRDSISYRQ